MTCGTTWMRVGGVPYRMAKCIPSCPGVSTPSTLESIRRFSDSFHARRGTQLVERHLRPIRGAGSAPPREEAAKQERRTRIQADDEDQGVVDEPGMWVSGNAGHADTWEVSMPESPTRLVEASYGLARFASRTMPRIQLVPVDERIEAIDHVGGRDVVPVDDPRLRPTVRASLNRSPVGDYSHRCSQGSGVRFKSIGSAASAMMTILLPTRPTKAFPIFEAARAIG